MSSQQKQSLTSALSTDTLSSAWESVTTAEGTDAQTLRILSSHLIVNAPEVLKASHIPPLLSALSNLASSSNLSGLDNTLRRKIFSFYIETSDLTSAGNALGSLRIDNYIGDPSDPYSFTPAEACDVYIQVAECFLEEDESASAETFVGKANQQKADIDPNEGNNWALLLRADTCFARVMDTQRKFLSASAKYYELSQATNDNLEQGDLIVLLGKAATCCILGDAGQLRQRLLTLISSDERLEALNGVDGYEAHYAVVKKMQQKQIIQNKEMEKFTQSLEQHQKAMGASGVTHVDKVVMEHNVLAVQRVYSSIRISALAKILETDGRNAMKIAATMIANKAIEGKIDEVEGLLHFTNETKSTDKELMSKAIESVCLRLNKVAAKAKEEMSNATTVS
ncbi:hypothetical protein TrVE_jg5780 [Triparma verrucosa]|uniref:COP9 signalosome complex subunit 4 n=1 Tax=Triparma verrucosa TaxID=1606542 RepID=A0A9W7BZT9_9STRA|nr:hypothetical protein TrVE_jg5780 [Triparma verrucosa]